VWSQYQLRATLQRLFEGIKLVYTCPLDWCSAESRAGECRRSKEGSGLTCSVWKLDALPSKHAGIGSARSDQCQGGTESPQEEPAQRICGCSNARTLDTAVNPKRPERGTLSSGLQLNDAAFRTDHGGVRTVDIPDLAFDGFLARRELLSDLFIRVPFSNHAKDPNFCGG